MTQDTIEVTIRLPQLLVGNLEKSILGTNYKDVSEYLSAFVCENLGSIGFNQDDEREVRKRLASLGYE